MHQLSSEILSFLLSPFNWIIILLLTGYFLRKTFVKNLCRILVLCIFLVFSNTWLFNWYANKWQSIPQVIKAGTVYSCGIVAGGFASVDADGNGYFNSAADRFIQVLKLYKLGTITHILISGGNGKINRESFREAAWVKGELTTLGIPDSAIFVEDKSNNTADNALYAKQILDSVKLPPPYLLITSAFHEPRASLLFKNVGLLIVPFPCNYMAGRESFKLASLIPQPWLLFAWETYLKEAVGFWWYKSKVSKA